VVLRLVNDILTGEFAWNPWALTVILAGIFSAVMVDGSIDGVKMRLLLASRLPPSTPCCCRVATMPKLVGSDRSKLVNARGPTTGCVVELMGPTLPVDDETTTLGLVINVLGAWVTFPEPPAAMTTTDEAVILAPMFIEPFEAAVVLRRTVLADMVPVVVRFPLADTARGSPGADRAAETETFEPEIITGPPAKLSVAGSLPEFPTESA